MSQKNVQYFSFKGYQTICVLITVRNSGRYFLNCPVLNSRILGNAAYLHALLWVVSTLRRSVILPSPGVDNVTVLRRCVLQIERLLQLTQAKCNWVYFKQYFQWEWWFHFYFIIGCDGIIQVITYLKWELVKNAR